MDLIRWLYAALNAQFPSWHGVQATLGTFAATLGLYHALGLWAAELGRRGRMLQPADGPGRSRGWLGRAAMAPGAWPVASLRWVPILGEFAMAALGASGLSRPQIGALSTATSAAIAWTVTAAVRLDFPDIVVPGLAAINCLAVGWVRFCLEGAARRRAGQGGAMDEERATVADHSSSKEASHEHE